MAAPTDVTLALESTEGTAPFAVAVVPTATDPDEVDTPSFTIEWGDGTADTVVDSGSPAAHAYSSPGRYTIAATAALGDDTTDADPVEITVTAANRFPVLEDTGVCVPWIDEDDFCAPLDDPAAVALAREAIRVATRWINDATLNQWSGPCTALVRPNPQRLTNCPPESRQSIDLSEWLPVPITEIVEVRVNGEVIDPEWYYLDGTRFVASLGWGDDTSPLRPWPKQTDRPAGAVDTWDLTARYRTGPPPPLARAARVLAEQIMKQCCGQECDLPDNVASVNRDGVTISFRPPSGTESGIPFVDQQIGLYGGNALAKPPKRMYDPASTTTAQVTYY